MDYRIDLNDIPGALMRDAEDNLYFSTTAEGALKWTYDAGALRGVQFIASPVIASDGTIIASATDGSVFGFTSAGELRWRVQIGTPVKKHDSTRACAGRRWSNLRFCGGQVGGIVCGWKKTLGASSAC